MTPVVLLVAFCTAMATIAVGRLVIDESRDRVDCGTALVVVGITLLSLLWVTLEEGMLTTMGRVALAIVGGGTVCLGVATIVRYWDESRDSNASYN